LVAIHEQARHSIVSRSGVIHAHELEGAWFEVAMEICAGHGGQLHLRPFDGENHSGIAHVGRVGEVELRVCLVCRSESDLGPAVRPDDVSRGAAECPHRGLVIESVLAENGRLAE